MEYVGLSISANSMAEASNNYGRGIAQNLEERNETLAEIELIVSKLQQENEEHRQKRSDIARDWMALRTTLQQLKTERQTEERIYHASRQENMGLQARCEILQEELEQSQESSEQAAEAFTRTFDDLQRTKSYSIAQTQHLNNKVIQERAACMT